MYLLLLHAGLMAGGLTAAATALVIAATRRRRPGWLKAHRAAGGGAALLFGGGTAAAVFMVNLGGGPHLGAPHTWVGAFTVAAGLVTPLVGLAQLSPAGRRLFPAFLHRLLGRTVNLSALAAAFLGLRLAGAL